MSSLLFQFFYGPEGKYEGYELLVEVAKTRNEGDNNALKIQINSIPMVEQMLDLSWHCSFRVQNVPELGSLNNKCIKVELRYTVVGKLIGGTAQVEGIPGRLENPMRVKEGGHIATEVQRLEWEFVEKTTSYILMYKYKKNHKKERYCELFLNGYRLWDQKCGSKVMNVWRKADPVSPPPITIHDPGLGDAFHCTLEVKVGMNQKGLLYGTAKINMRDLGERQSAVTAADGYEFEPLLQPVRAPPRLDGADVQFKRPRKVSHIARERQAMLHASNPHAELVSSRTPRGVVFHSLSTQSLPSKRTSSFSSTEAPQQAAQRAFHPSASTGTQGIWHTGSGLRGPVGSHASREMLGPAGSGPLAPMPGSTGSDASDSGTALQHMPSAPPLELAPVHSAFAREPGGSVGRVKSLRSQRSGSSVEGSEPGGSSPSAVSRSQASWDWPGYQRLGPQPPGLQQPQHEPVYGRDASGYHGPHGSQISSRLSDASTTSSLQSSSPPGAGTGFLAYQQRRAGGPPGDESSSRGAASASAPLGSWAHPGYPRPPGPGPGGGPSGQPPWWGLDRAVSVPNIRGPGPGWQHPRPVPQGTGEWVSPP